MQDVEAYYQQLMEDLRSEASLTESTSSDCFFEMASRCLEISGEVDAVDRASFTAAVGGKKIRVDGSGGDPSESEGVLSLIISDFFETKDPSRINAASATQSFRQLANFLVYSRQESFRSKLPAKSPVLDLAAILDSQWSQISKIKLVLVTNAIFSSRLDAWKAGKVAGVDVTYSIWDLARIHRFEASTKDRDELEINFRDEFGGSVPALLASEPTDQLQSYLMVVPGTQLAALYDKWGARLLEANVRSFLQARGKVNQGIRDTIKSNPRMFFSYNNGIAATAEGVQTESSSHGLRIVSATNLQIVNGGQTTASIHAALRTSPESLASVRVQMKLTVVPPEQSEEIVPKISEYANSQNKVSAADFFSNHPFHVRVEEFSRRMLAPASAGKTKDTKWFYERARGQYLVERSRVTGADRKRFDGDFPKSQLFTKTDLAKVDFTFKCKPDFVSRGAQKNFAEFATEIGTVWAQSERKFSEAWFRALISKLIIFRHLERILPSQDWYPGGYRANIVTYGIAKLVWDVSSRDRVLDLSSVWRGQVVPAALSDALLRSAEVASSILSNPPSDKKNITEWAKKPACWEAVRAPNVNYAASLQACLIVSSDPKAEGYTQEDTKPVKLAGWNRPH